MTNTLRRGEANSVCSLSPFLRGEGGVRGGTCAEPNKECLLMKNWNQNLQINFVILWNSIVDRTIAGQLPLTPTLSP
jgi:hypothetical protein